jgi:hypothetical protein
MNKLKETIRKWKKRFPMVSAIIGILAMISSLFLGFYITLYVCFYKSIVILIEMYRHPDTVSSGLLAWSVIKLIFGTFFGIVGGKILFFIGFLIFISSAKNS